MSRPRLASGWQSFEAWVGTRSSAAALFALALAVFALQSVVLPVHRGVTWAGTSRPSCSTGTTDPVLPSVLNTRGPLAALGVGVPLELGGAMAEIWLGVLYAASIVAWGFVALTFGPRAAAADDRAASRLPGLRHPLPRAGERCPVRRRVRGLGGPAVAGITPPVRSDLSRCGARDGPARARPAFEPGADRLGGPPALPPRSVGPAAGVGGFLLRRFRRRNPGLEGDSPPALRRRCRA